MSNLATITNNILADSGIDDINVIVSTGSYADPAWITSLAWTKITGAPANIVTGTGTTNYLPKFTGASTIGNSVIQEASGFIGIGVSPSSNIDILGSSSRLRLDGTSSSFQILSRNTANSTTNPIIFDADTYTYNRGGVFRMLLDSSGNLGLGVTPSAWDAGFTVAQIGTGGSVYSANSNRNIYLATNAFFSSGFKYVASDFAGITGWEDGSYVWLTAPSGTAGNAISFTQAMTLDASGNLGIGIPNPSNRLQITAAAGSSHARWTESATTVGFVGGAQGIITGHNGKFAVRAESGLVLSGSGNSADVVIASGGAATFSSSVTATQFVANGASTVPNLILNGPSTTWTRYQTSGTDRWDIGNNVGGLSSNQFSFYSNGAGRNVLVIQQDGNVGIGTTAPTGNLHIFGTDPAFRIQNSGTGNMQFGQWDGTNNRIQSSGRDFLLTQTDSFNMLFHTNATERMRITSGGNVLIGTTTDAGFKLQVNGEGSFYQSATNSTAYLRVENNRSRNAALRLSTTVGDYLVGVGIGADVNQFQIYDNVAGATRLTISSTGAATFSSFVGINGSPATSFPLEAYINSSTAYTTSSRGNVMRVYNSNTSANIFAGIELGGAGTANDGLAGLNAVVTGSGSAALTFYTRDSNTFAERMRITSGGNVGIGTTSPAWMFEVNKDTSSGSFGQYPAISINNPNASGFSAYYFFSGGSNKGGFEFSNGDNSLRFFNGAERMRITSGANVLIGTTTDAGFKLDVNGTGRFSGDLSVGSGSGSVSLAINRGAAANGNGLRFQTAATNNWYIGSAATSTNTDLEIYNHNTATTNLRLSYSTGAATFSSSVTASRYTSIGSSSYTNDFVNTNIGTVGQNIGLRFGYDGSTYNKGAVYFISKSANGVGDLIFALNNSENSANVSTSDERMRITSGGNVLIGTTSDNGARLQVSGNGHFSQADANVYIQSTSGSGKNWQLQSFSDGNLYINVSGVFSALSLNGSTGAATFSSSVTAGGNILGASIIMTPVTANPSSTAPALYQPATGELGINVNGGERMRIFSDGNVFIGSSPSNAGFKLDVNGTGRFSGNVTVVSSSSSTSIGTTGQIQITSSTGLAAPAGDIYLQSVIDSATPGDRGTAFVVQTGRTSGIAERFRIASTGAATFSSGIATSGYTASSSYAAIFNGAVGIGTSTPSTTDNLTLSSSTAFNLQLTNPGTGGVTWQIGATSNDYGSGGNRLVFTYGNASANSVLTLVQSTGNVLIGTTTDASYKLDVNGTGRFSAASTDYALTLQNIQDDSQGLLVRATDNDSNLYLIRAQSSNSSTSQTWVDRFTLAKNGAANFSSSVTANGTLSLQASATGSTATHVPVFTADPASTTRSLLTRTLQDFKFDVGSFIAKGVRSNAGDYTRTLDSVNDYSLWQDNFDWLASYNQSKVIIEAQTTGNINSSNTADKQLTIGWGISSDTNFNGDDYCTVNVPLGTGAVDYNVIINGTITITSNSELKMVIRVQIASGNVIEQNVMRMANVTAAGAMLNAAKNIAFTGKMNVTGTHTWSQRQTYLRLN